MAVIRIFFVLFFFNNFCFADPLTSYNQSLLNYEKKLEECKKSQSIGFKDNPVTDISEESIRVALGYFILRSSEKCSELERSNLIKDINLIKEDSRVAQLIRFNARDLLFLFEDSKKSLAREKNKFLNLKPEDRKKLKTMEAYKRPFDPTMAIDHYLGHKD